MRDWYELTQGSRLIPMDWLRALKTVTGAAFLSRETLEGYGYLYFPGSSGPLPVGFVKDMDADGASHLGFNCSACHTSKLKGNGTEVFVHGGSTMADFQACTTDLIEAVELAQSDDVEFSGFAGMVLGISADDEARERLRAEMRTWAHMAGRAQDHQ